MSVTCMMYGALNTLNTTLAKYSHVKVIQLPKMIDLGNSQSRHHTQNKPVEKKHKFRYFAPKSRKKINKYFFCSRECNAISQFLNHFWKIKNNKICNKIISHILKAINRETTSEKQCYSMLDVSNQSCTTALSTKYFLMNKHITI